MMKRATLRFKDISLEKDFNEWYLPTELKIYRYALILGVITYFIFIPLDNILYDGDTTAQFLRLRLTIAAMTVIMYALTHTLITNHNRYQIFAITMAFICFGANVRFTFFKNVDEFYFYTANSVLIIFIFILLNIRFFYLRFIAVFYVVIHLLLLKLNFDYNLQNFAHQAYGIISVATISLASNWIIEFQKRQNFLNHRLIETQKEALKNTIQEKDDLLVELKERNQELAVFNQSVSHDLKTPLRNINVFSTLFEKKQGHQLDEEGLTYLGFIKDSTNKMNTLINDLLEYSRMRQRELKFELVNIDSLIAETFQEQAQPLTKKPLLMKPKLPAIKGDKVLLKQVCGNLISNAIKYSSKKEEIKIEIGAIENQSTTTYFITDNGVGFDMQYAARLFMPFSRLHNEKDFKGTGVGLSLVHRIIKKHGGKIWAESEVDKGSTFYFQLPVH